MENTFLVILPTELTVIQSSVRLIDPHIFTDNRDRRSILVAIYEALVRRGKDGAYYPAIAESWTLEDDARTWTFKLRNHMPFHNGDILKAKDVEATVERVCDPTIGGELGTQGVFQSYLGDAVIKAVDEHTVRIITAEPMADLLDLLVDIPIVPWGALDSLPDTPVGSGPYQLVEANDRHIMMKAFPRFWGGRPPVEQIYWQAEPDAQQRVAALLAGEADIVADLTLEGKQTIETAEQVRAVTLESNMCIIFMCNAQSGVCTDKRVRQALNYALDVSDIIHNVMGGAARPLNGPLTPLHFGYDPSTPPYPYDPARARVMLAKAGYENGLEIVLDIPTIIPNESLNLTQLMTEQYNRVGITTEVKVFPDREEYAEMVRAKHIDDASCFDSSPLSTYRVLREKFHSGVRGPWWQGYINREVDALIDQAQATVDDAQRRELYRRAYRIIRDDAPWIFLYSPILSWGVGPRARSWTVGIDGLIRLA